MGMFDLSTLFTNRDCSLGIDGWGVFVWSPDLFIRLGGVLRTVEQNRGAHARTVGQHIASCYTLGVLCNLHRIRWSEQVWGELRCVWMDHGQGTERPSRTLRKHSGGLKNGSAQISQILFPFSSGLVVKAWHPAP